MVRHDVMRERRMKQRTIAAVVAIFLCACFMVQADSKADNTKISQLAFSAYRKHMKEMKAPLLSEERVNHVVATDLLFDVPSFAKAGTSIIEVRIGHNNDDVRAILWYNPDNERVKFVIGPWIAGKKQDS